MQNKKTFFFITIIITSFLTTNLTAGNDPGRPQTFVIKVPRQNYSLHHSDYHRLYQVRQKSDQKQLEGLAYSTLSGFLIGSLLGLGTNAILKHVEKKNHPMLDVSVSRLPKEEGEKYDYVVKRENRRKGRRRVAGIVGTVCGLLASVFLGGVFFSGSLSM